MDVKTNPILYMRTAVMITKKNVAMSTFLAGTLALCPPAQADSDNAGFAVKFYGEGHANVLSTRLADRMTQSGIDLKGFDCFELPILDPGTERPRGTGVDCLRPISTAGDVNGAGLQMEAYTFFFLNHGMLVNHGCTSVRPFFQGVGDTGVTHLTGSIGPSEFGADPDIKGPEVCHTDQGIVRATGAFRGLEGEARLSGAVNMHDADKGIIKFSCIFVVKPLANNGKR